MLDLFDFLHYLNTTKRDATYSRIIIYLFNHLNEIQTLTITEIAERCFVSPATLTRFCHHFGLSNFASLRESLIVLGTMKKHSGLRMKEQELIDLKDDPKSYLTSYGAEIITAVNDVIATIDIEQVDHLLADIHQADEVILIGYSSTLELAKDLQLSFLLNQKLVFVGETAETQQAFVEELSEKSIVIVISSYGSLLNRSSELMRKISDSPAKSILLTQHTQNTLTNQFDLSMNVTTTNYVRIGNYPLTFFLDYFVRRYTSLYQ
ncbi:MurR/RpiR family transcriptional regulator [Candidatus Enterococcus ikei]|uniref:MurR/RpiR family transcriptional regulator n=1 Tax=Candidatus Enterococcus ikei TaxID=2815326 RepID=A0ABS3GX63_9ENTE|nr:SIS domain-containing protein [Enterococcus sp. DIV0869a]MBO0439863.1 MurR/RpiR family transcriptional regulator [Enterococcus sp. DIV0869a]